MGIWHAMGAWLARVPLHDPVDRRNAPFVQLLLLGMGVLLPLNKVIKLCFTSFAESVTTTALAADLVTDAMMAAAAWASLFLVRAGRFRQGVKLYLAVMLFTAVLAYAWIGLDRLSNDPLPLLLLGLGGLVLGRRTLWTVYAVLLAVFAVGMLSDVIHQWKHGPIELAPGKRISMTLGYVVVTIVLDRTIAALRESLAESNARGEMLAIVNERLHREMEAKVRAQQLLIHAEKLETVGRVASGIVHDFSNIFGVIAGYAQRRERLADSGMPALLDALEGVERTVKRGMAVTHRLLTLSRREPERMEVICVDEALRDLLPMVCQLFDANVRVELDLGGEPLHIWFDRMQFELVILSMAANARDAMPHGGRFEMGARRRDDADGVEITLSDSGTGMAEAVLAQVFDAFFTTKPPGSGTGLGLAVVRGLIVGAGGDIAVGSAQGEGARFVIRLPSARAMQEADELTA